MAEGFVALVAEKTADGPGRVIMIDVKDVSLGTRVGPVALADCASAMLRGEHPRVVFGRDSIEPTPLPMAGSKTDTVRSAAYFRAAPRWLDHVDVPADGTCSDGDLDRSVAFPARVVHPAELPGDALLHTSVGGAWDAGASMGLPDNIGIAVSTPPLIMLDAPAARARGAVAIFDRAELP